MYIGQCYHILFDMKFSFAFWFSISLIAQYLNVAHGFAHLLRRLIGSNCVKVGTARVPEYYQCFGCIMEEAVACVDDMRQNISGNVNANCDMTIITESFVDACCPRFVPKGPNGRIDLDYLGSAYPNTLRCIKSVGCDQSVIYSQLVEECAAVCPPASHLDQFGKHSCFADFNSATSLRVANVGAIAVIALTSIFFLIL